MPTWVSAKPAPECLVQDTRTPRRWRRDAAGDREASHQELWLGGAGQQERFTWFSANPLFILFSQASLKNSERALAGLYSSGKVLVLLIIFSCYNDTMHTSKPVYSPLIQDFACQVGILR